MNQRSYNQNNNYDENSKKYSKIEVTAPNSTIYLSFRDIMQLLERYCNKPVQNLKILDYGCGAGRSSRYLKYIGAQNVFSVDVNPSMIEKAISFDKEGNYQVIASAKLPVDDLQYDLIFCSFVLVEISTKEKILKIFKEVSRVLKRNGIFLVVTLSKDFFDQKYEWLSYNQKFDKNFNLRSGDCGKFIIDDIGMIFSDYYWTEDDIIKISSEASLNLLEIHRPLGKKDDNIEWKSEQEVSPYDIFIFNKEEM